MQGIEILGTGSYLPDYVISNDDFAAFLDTSDDWIYTRTGMRERRIAVDEPTWYLGAQAAGRALKSANISPAEIDMIIATTATSDYAFPTLASCVQSALEIESCIALDINLACTACTFAIDMARRYMQTGDVKHVLVVSAESMSQRIDYTDRSTAVLFGDGAGAMVLRQSDRLYAAFQSNDAAGAKYIYHRYPRREYPFSANDTSEHDCFPDEKYGSTYMNGREVYKFATRAMPDAVKIACERAGISHERLDMLFVHQANIRIVETAAKNLGLPMERVFMNIEKYGNTSSASMPICLDEATRAGKIKRGDVICFVGFGAGLSSGAVVMEY